MRRAREREKKRPNKFTINKKSASASVFCTRFVYLPSFWFHKFMYDAMCVCVSAREGGRRDECKILIKKKSHQFYIIIDTRFISPFNDSFESKLVDQWYIYIYWCAVPFDTHTHTHTQALTTSTSDWRTHFQCIKILMMSAISFLLFSVFLE